MSEVDSVLTMLLDLDGDALFEAISNASRPGPFDGIDTILVPALEKMGELWDSGDVALSQLYLAGKLCEDVADQLFAARESGTYRGGLSVGIAVLDDFHMLGKRIVYAVLRGAGYAVRDYGRKTVDELASAVAADGIDLLFISTLMLPSALRIRDLSGVLRQKGISCKIVVGGAPFRFDPYLWKEVGADAMGSNAVEALDFVRRYAEERKVAAR